ncbi:hypothetical protein [Streptomyces sp. NPDC046988]|uniref:hypothetical protein n=1 Tax=Streptomyces sp. NPDC046988 TaxID=3154922 RepID=UPI00340FD02F
MPRPTLFRALLKERRWDNWCVFATHLERASRDLARQDCSSCAFEVSIARRTFDRWMDGDLEGLPHRDTQAATEYLLGFSFDTLFEPPRNTSVLTSQAEKNGPLDVGPSGGELAESSPRRSVQPEVAMQAFDEQSGE